LNQNNKVSIVIPIYNSEQFLQESLESVLNQTYKDVEIIAINDGSSDSSLDILNQYSKKITIISQENKGLASALNNGIQHMSGRWFKWFSPDDVMLPNTIEELANNAKTLPPNSIIYSNWHIIDENGDILREFVESNYNDLSKFDFNVRLLDGQLINVNTTLIPSELFKKITFKNLDDPVVIDYDFFLRCALIANVNFHLVTKSLIKYRIHQSQLSHKNITQTLDYVEHVKEEILSEITDPEKTDYLSSLHKYQKSKPLHKKTLEFGLKMLSKSPSWASDRILIFYLSKVRRSR